jgi:hypothetical protein
MMNTEGFADPAIGASWRLRKLVSDYNPLLLLCELPACKVQGSRKGSFFLLGKSFLNHFWAVVLKLVREPLAVASVDDTAIFIHQNRDDDAVESDVCPQCGSIVERKWR